MLMHEKNDTSREVEKTFSFRDVEKLIIKANVAASEPDEEFAPISTYENFESPSEEFKSTCKVNNGFIDPENVSDDLKEDDSSFWVKSRIDPMRLLEAFPALRLKKGFVLRAYTSMSEMDGSGIVWAMPDHVQFPDPGKCIEKGPEGDPKPPGAVDDIMAVFEGDGSLWSYLSASIFFREMSEFGAFGHMCEWSTNEIIGNEFWDYFIQHDKFPNSEDEESDGVLISVPPAEEFEIFLKKDEEIIVPDDEFDDLEELELVLGFADLPDEALDRPSSTPDGLKWLSPQPTDWEPMVRKKNNIVTVTFYTFSGAYVETLNYHVDTYKVGSYRLKSEDIRIAEGDDGYMF